MPLIIRLWLVFSGTRLLSLVLQDHLELRDCYAACYSMYAWGTTPRPGIDLHFSALTLLDLLFIPSFCKTGFNITRLNIWEVGRSTTNKMNSFPGSSLAHTADVWYRRPTTLQLHTFQPSTEAQLALRQYILIHFFPIPDMLWSSRINSFKCRTLEERYWRKKTQQLSFLQITTYYMLEQTWNWNCNFKA